MGTISAKTLNEALAKAKNVGVVEESFVIGDCEVTLRNLRPDEYAAVLQDCQGLEDVQYLNTYQKGHIARSIVAINGVDLHGVEFVDSEEPDPKKPGQAKHVKLELHTYLLKNVIETWGKEAVYTAYRKFGDVVELAERKAKEGIQFLMPEETDEEKYRRLLLEAKEYEDNIPNTMVDQILDDVGLMRKSTADEIKAAMERADQLAREQEQSEPSLEPVSETAIAPVQVAVAVEATPQAEVNRPSAQRPPDPHQTLQEAIAARRQPVASSLPVVQQATAEAPAASRASQIAALEAEAGVGGVDPTALTLPGRNGQPIPVAAYGAATEVVEIKKQESFDPNAARQILDKPPVAGINPRYRPPTRL